MTRSLREHPTLGYKSSEGRRGRTGPQIAPRSVLASRALTPVELAPFARLSAARTVASSFFRAIHGVHLDGSTRALLIDAEFSVATLIGKSDQIFRRQEDGHFLFGL